MKKEYCDIFNLCFPQFHMSYERFCSLLLKEQSVYFEQIEDDEVVAFAIVEEFAIRLICVSPAYQNHGIGTRLLSDIEENRKEQGYESVITGGVSSQLFIGATSDSWHFFESRGYESVGKCDEMLLELKDFHLEKYALHGKEIAEYGWFEGDMKEILDAVSSVDEGWTPYFTESEKIYVARVDGEIASFCLVDTDCQKYLADHYGRVGMPGCVGAIPKFRNKGIALEMVARVTDYLKEQGMDISFIFFTGVADWYKKIGYQIFLSEIFGTKRI